jgi:uncharacterized membrane protein YgdD (TMEM256/DUF423 family)
MNQRTTLASGILMAGLGVCVGAFGAHALKDILESAGRTHTFELAVRYQFYHAFALLITGLLMMHFPSKKLVYASWSFLTGILFFSGSLYALCFTGVTVLGAVTPLGGLFFIAGWILLLLSIIKK